MESFIVRIYRREETGAVAGAAEVQGPVGTVEATATGERTAFRSHQELLSALGANGKVPPKPAKPRRSSAARQRSPAGASVEKK